MSQFLLAAVKPIKIVLLYFHHGSANKEIVYMKITTTNTTSRSSEALFTFKGTLWEDTGQKYAFPVEVNILFNTVLYLVMLRSATNKLSYLKINFM